MESLRDIRQNIKAIRSTQQIMQTMKMISSARIRKAQEAMDNARPFAKKMLDMVAPKKAKKAGRRAFLSTKQATKTKSAWSSSPATKDWPALLTRSSCAPRWDF